MREKLVLEKPIVKRKNNIYYEKNNLKRLLLCNMLCPFSLVVEHQSCKLEVLGSIPREGFSYN
jgi:hypothetical protein